MRNNPAGNSRRGSRSRPLLQQLEPRIVFSAGPLDAAYLADAGLPSMSPPPVEPHAALLEAPGTEGHVGPLEAAESSIDDAAHPYAIIMNDGDTATVEQQVWLTLSDAVLGQWSGVRMATNQWSQLSGPTTAVFSDAADVKSQVQFAAPGQYELQLLAQSGGTTVTGKLQVNVTAPVTQVASAELPRQSVDTTYALPHGGQTWVVNAGDNLQAVLDAAQAGDVVVLEAGATFEGNFVVRPKSGEGWLYVISSDAEQLPAVGSRVAPTDAVHMPKIVAPNQFNPALIIEPGVTNVRFVGVEITTAYARTDGVQYGLVRVGWKDGVTPSDPMAKHVIFDRSFIHGTTTGNVRDGIVTYNVQNFALVDSHISDIHGIGYEAHGVHVFNSPGPVHISNNYIAAAGINVFVGDNTLDGAPPPADITIVGNHLQKPWSWKVDHPDYAGNHWLVKNLLEVKAAQRVLIEGNLMENVWVDAQHGEVLVITPRGGAISDVTFRNNVARNFEGGMNINSADVSLHRVTVDNNIMFNMQRPDRYFIKLAGTPGHLSDINITHNTLLAENAGGFLVFNGQNADEIQGLNFSDNIVTQGTYGILGNNQGTGFRPTDFYATDYHFLSNVVIGGDSTTFRDETDHWRDWLCLPFHVARRWVSGSDLRQYSRFQALGIIAVPPGRHERGRNWSKC